MRRTVIKQAFRAMNALYEFQRLPFGLSNSPPTFMRLMGKCFGHLYKNGLIIYLDDILVNSRSISEMVQKINID